MQVGQGQLGDWVGGSRREGGTPVLGNPGMGAGGVQDGLSKGERGGKCERGGEGFTQDLGGNRIQIKYSGGGIRTEDGVCEE